MMEGTESEAMNSLFIVTNDYPYGRGDSIFVLPELLYLRESFEVTVISTSLEEKIQAELLDGVKYRHFQLKLTAAKKLRYILRFFLNRFCLQELYDIIRNGREHRLGRIYKSIEFFACAEEFYHFLQETMDDELSEKKGIFLTYWCNACSMSLLLHSLKYQNLKHATRLHGYDVYEERYAFGRQPFKNFINDRLDKLFFVSHNAREYYFKVHPRLEREKTFVSSLGVERMVPGLCRTGGRQFFTLVSCSSTIPLKRVNLIIEALSLVQTEIPVKWIHFGNGTSQKEMIGLAREKLSNKAGVSYEYMGEIDNEEIKRFYLSEKPDCFITTSSTEGSPVSVMEALACGIPVIGTAVGDIPRMVRQNGVLLPANPQKEEVAAALEKIVSASPAEKEFMSRQSLKIWEEGYDREKNEREFVQELKKLLL